MLRPSNLCVCAYIWPLFSVCPISLSHVKHTVTIIFVCRTQIVEAQYEPIPPGQYSDKLSETVTRSVALLTSFAETAIVLDAILTPNASEMSSSVNADSLCSTVNAFDENFVKNLLLMLFCQHVILSCFFSSLLPILFPYFKHRINFCSNVFPLDASDQIPTKDQISYRYTKAK